MDKKVSKQKEFLLGLDVGGTKCAVVLGDRNLRVIDRLSFMTRPRRGLKRTLKDLFAAVDEVLGRNGLRKQDVYKAGISCGGPLDSRKGMILSPPNLPGWHKVPLVKLLQNKIGCSVRLENDGNACAVAEWKLGAGRGFQNIIFLTFGTGMGAGLILNGKLYRGTNDMAGEIGHIRLEKEGPLGYGKRGSLEGFCSGGGIARMARMKNTGFKTAKDVAEAALVGDATALGLIKNSADHLGQGLSVLIDLLNPQRIILGGIYYRNEKLFKPMVEKVVQKESLGLSRSACRVVPSGLGEQIGDVACLAVAVFEDEV